MASMDDLWTRVNPTSCLPRVKDEPAAEVILRSLAHLATLYSPHSLTQDEVAYATSLQTESDGGHADQTAYQDAFDSAKVDDNERRYAMSWLTRLIGSGLYWVDDEDERLSSDVLLDLAGRILGGHASLEEAGAISREFSFPLKEAVVIPEADLLAHPAAPCAQSVGVVLRDDPLPPSDKASEANTTASMGSSQDAAAAVGVQTWGASIVVSDVLVRHPTLFHSALGQRTGERLRIAELGAGTGLLGMAAAKLLQQQGAEADVVLTDYHTQVLRNLDFNVGQNFDRDARSSVAVSVEHLDWLEVHQKVLAGEIDDAEQPRYDLLLLADVIYDPSHAHWIRSSIERLLRKPKAGDENTARAHIIMAVRGSGKFEGLFRTVEDAFKPRSSSSSLPSLSGSSTITPLDTMPGTPALLSEPTVSDAGKSSCTQHSDLLRKRMDALSLRAQDQQQHRPRSAEVGILRRRRLDKRSSVGRNDEQEYLWFEVGWTQ